MTCAHPRLGCATQFQFDADSCTDGSSFSRSPPRTKRGRTRATAQNNTQKDQFGICTISSFQSGHNHAEPDGGLYLLPHTCVDTALPFHIRHLLEPCHGMHKACF